MPDSQQVVASAGLRLYSVPAELTTCTEAFYRQTPTDVRTAMATVKDPSDILRSLLAGEHSTLAGRIAGAYRNAGNDRFADDIVKTMKAAEYAAKESDPFEDRLAARGSARLHARVVQAFDEKDRPCGSCRIGTLRVRVHTSLHGRERSHWAISDERHAGIRRLPMESRVCGASRSSHVRLGGCECSPRYQTVFGLPGRPGGPQQ